MPMDRPLKKRINKSVKVCGRKFQIVWGHGNIGGQFHTIHPKTGGGLIVLGDSPKDEYYQLNNLVHELLEIIMTLKNVRWYETEEKILFSMTHEEFVEVSLELTRTLIDSGAIKVREVGDK